MFVYVWVVRFLCSKWKMFIQFADSNKYIRMIEGGKLETKTFSGPHVKVYMYIMNVFYEFYLLSTQHTISCSFQCVDVSCK